MSSVSAKPKTTTFAADDWRPFSWRRILPISVLLLCWLIIWPYRGVIAFELFGLMPHRRAPLVVENMPPLEFTLDAEGKLDLPSDPQFKKRTYAHENAFETVLAISLPGGIVQLLSAIFREDHREWMPSSISPLGFRSWRAITWPVTALPFWWMAGRGLEALTAARRKLVFPRMRWLETLIAFMLLAGGFTLAIGVAFFSTDADRADPQFPLFGAAGAMWAVLGSLTVVAKLAQWRIKKQTPAVVNPSP